MFRDMLIKTSVDEGGVKWSTPMQTMPEKLVTRNNFKDATGPHLPVLSTAFAVASLNRWVH